MPNLRSPRRGSMGYWPRKKAKRIYNRVRHWPKSNDSKMLGFAGYKAGMTHVFVTDHNPNSKTKGQHIVRTATILECPPISVFGFRCYTGKISSCDVLAEKLDQNLSRKIRLPNESKTHVQMKKAEGKSIAHVNLLCHTNPPFKKKPEVFEIAIGGPADHQLKFAKDLLGKTVKISDVFKEGDYIDVSAVTKGHGYTGTVKRFGIRVKGRKDEQGHRHIGCHGTNWPGKIRYTVPDSGQGGFHTRTELNKRILKITDGKAVNPKGGIVNYGLVNGDCALIDGSVPGPQKRLIRFRIPMRLMKTVYPTDVQYISLTSKQGR